MLTKEKLEQRQAALLKDQQQLLSQINMIIGALKEIEWDIAEFDKVEPVEEVPVEVVMEPAKEAE